MKAKEDLYSILVDLIETGKKHKYYDRVVKLREFNHQIMTGETQTELVIKYKPKESDDQKEQRKRLYNTRTPYVANKILCTFKEAERVDGVVNNIYYEDDSKNSEVAIIQSKMAKYNANEDLQKYVHDAVRRLNFYDPNAWIVNEFTYYNSDLPQSYPLEVSSIEAVNYEYKYGKLEWLAICQPVTIKTLVNKGDFDPIKKTETKSDIGERYTIYGINYAYRFTQLGDGDTNDLETIEIKGKKYSIELFETKYQDVPAIRAGYIKDPLTDWNTYVTPLEPAKHILLDIINTKSEYDLHKALHGFLQKYAYAEKCTYVDATNTGDRCKNGIMNGGSTCPSCKGTGKKVHTTVQDVILVDIPETKEEHIPLSQYIHYVEVPQHIIQGWKDDLTSLEIDVSYAVFNKDTFSKAEIQSTATEIRLNKQSVYNVLSEFADKISEVYRFLAYQIANTLDKHKGLIIDFSIPRDFKLDTVDELLNMRKTAIESGAPYDIIAEIDFKIMQKQYQDNPSYVDQVKAQEAWRPFKDKSKEEVLSIVALLPELDLDRLLYTYFDKIFSKIWAEGVLFHKLKYPAQKLFIEKELQAIKAAKELEKQLTSSAALATSSKTDINGAQ